MKILILFAHPHAVSIPGDLCSSLEHKWRCFGLNLRALSLFLYGQQHSWDAQNPEKEAKILSIGEQSSFAAHVTLYDCSLTTEVTWNASTKFLVSFLYFEHL